MRNLIALFISTFCLFMTPARADEPYAITPSGATEAFFDLNVVETSDLLANSCIDFGWTTVSSVETMVVCQVPVDTGTAILAALAGPRYATPPREFIRFNLAGYNGLTRVQATGWREQQTAFGQMQRTELGNENYHNSVTGFLVSLGGLYPPGTKFTNHAGIGVVYEYVEEPRDGMLLKSFREESPFAAAGMQVGDIITRVARERIKDENDLSDGLHKAIRDETFEVEYYREGKRAKVSVNRVFRSAAGPLPEPTIAEIAPSPPPTTIVQNEFSVAEELERLVALRDQGVLTDEEFAEQKAKVLDR